MAEQEQTVETNVDDEAAKAAAVATTTTDTVLTKVEDPFESRAKRMGWAPKEEFRGDGGALWVDAETFVKRAEQSADILIERNRALDRRLESTEKTFNDYKKNSEKQLTGMSQQMKDLQETLVDFRNFASTANERAYRRARFELETEMRQAVSEADMAKFDKAKAQVDELDKEATQFVKAETKKPNGEEVEKQVQAQPASTEAVKEPEKAQVPAPPEVSAWLARNQWFLNPEFAYLNQYAQKAHMKLLQAEPGLSLSQNLEKVTEQTRKKFPEEFGINPRREEASATVTTGSTAKVTTVKKMGYDDLPDDAKKMCDKYVKQIPGYTKSEYVSVYFGEEAE